MKRTTFWMAMAIWMLVSAALTYLAMTGKLSHELLLGILTIAIFIMVLVGGCLVCLSSHDLFLHRD